MQSLVFSNIAAFFNFTRPAPVLDSNARAIAQFAKIPEGTATEKFGLYLAYALKNQEYDSDNDYVLENYPFVLQDDVELEFPENVLLHRCTVSGSGTVRFCMGTLTAISDGVSVIAQGESALAVAAAYGSTAIAAVRQAMARASADGAVAEASAGGAVAVADAEGAQAIANARGARAESLACGAQSFATASGSEAHALKKASLATATAPGARSFGYEGGKADSLDGGRAFNDCVNDTPGPLGYLDNIPARPESLCSDSGHRYIGSEDL